MRVFLMAVVGGWVAGCAAPSAVSRAAPEAEQRTAAPAAAPTRSAPLLTASSSNSRPAELAPKTTPFPFDENCSHVVGREWQDIDYRDEGMTWQKQQAIHQPKGIAHFKDVANLRQFFQVESRAPYFQKLYRVKGAAP